MRQRARKPKLSGDEFAARFQAERVRQQQRYCDAFERWRQCTDRHCRRQCGCRGDSHECLKRALAAVPHDVQWRARQDMLAAMPRNIGAPERAARLCMPQDFLRETAEQASEYFAQFEAKRRRASR